MTEELRIEAPAADLEDLRQTLYTELGNDLDVQEITAIVPGELREPILIAIAVTLAPAVVGGIIKVINRWLSHRERMAEVRVEALGVALQAPSREDAAELWDRLR